MALFEYVIGAMVCLYMALGSASWGYILLRLGWPNIRKLEADYKRGWSIILGAAFAVAAIGFSAGVFLLRFSALSPLELLLLGICICFAFSIVLFTVRRKLVLPRKVKVAVPKRFVSASIIARKAVERMPEGSFAPAANESVIAVLQRPAPAFASQQPAQASAVKEAYSQKKAPVQPLPNPADATKLAEASSAPPAGVLPQNQAGLAAERAMDDILERYKAKGSSKKPAQTPLPKKSPAVDSAMWKNSPERPLQQPCQTGIDAKPLLPFGKIFGIKKGEIPRQKFAFREKSQIQPVPSGAPFAKEQATTVKIPPSAESNSKTNKSSVQPATPLIGLPLKLALPLPQERPAAPRQAAAAAINAPVKSVLPLTQDAPKNGLPVAPKEKGTKSMQEKKPLLQAIMQALRHPAPQMPELAQKRSGQSFVPLGVFFKKLSTVPQARKFEFRENAGQGAKPKQEMPLTAPPMPEKTRAPPVPAIPATHPVPGAMVNLQLSKEKGIPAGKVTLQQPAQAKGIKEMPAAVPKGPPAQASAIEPLSQLAAQIMQQAKAPRQEAAKGQAAKPLTVNAAQARPVTLPKRAVLSNARWGFSPISPRGQKTMRFNPTGIKQQGPGMIGWAFTRPQVPGIGSGAQELSKPLEDDFAFSQQKDRKSVDDIIRKIGRMAAARRSDNIISESEMREASEESKEFIRQSLIEKLRSIDEKKQKPNDAGNALPKSAKLLKELLRGE